MSPEDRERRKSFESKRKAHYNEFYAVKMARQLMAEADDDEEDEEEKEEDSKADAAADKTASKEEDSSMEMV